MNVNEAEVRRQWESLHKGTANAEKHPVTVVRRQLVECMDAGPWQPGAVRPKLTEGRVYVVKQREHDNLLIEGDDGKTLWAHARRFLVLR